MPRRISILPDAVADQIAAGEVVERPASVVKELVENAIDAGATHVRIEVEQGGKTLIEVSDDGHGMGREDALLALDRHATSKIRNAGDLVGVRSFGFRGEALPAIASVSRFALVTAETGAEATRVEVTGGRVDSVQAAARQPGTTVSVRALFFNTPARRKFLRSVSSETRAASEVVATLALAHPEVGFEFHADGRCRLAMPSAQPVPERLAAVWGRDLAGTVVPVSYVAGGFHVTGFTQRPGDARPTGRRAQLFVNGRPFKDPFLVRAAEAGYRAAIAPGDRPSLFLDIASEPSEVDVNVHPAKLEVRFRDRLGVERAVEEAVRDAIGGMAAAAPVGDWRPLPAYQGTGSRDAGGPRLPPELLDLLAPATEPAPAGGPSGAPLPPVSADPVPEPIAQLFDTYIVYTGSEGLVFVDQHSAHERVLYEEVLARMQAGDAPAQRLLLPATVDLTDEELEAAEAHREPLRRIGYEFEGFGGRTVVLHTVPSPHRRFDGVACFGEVVADLARGRFGGWANRMERFAATYGCRAAVKAGDRLDPTEMRELLRRLFATSLPPHDVHGRATIVQLSREELERRFGRR